MKLFKILSILVLFFCFVIPSDAQDVCDYGSPLEIITLDTDSLRNVWLESGTLDDNVIYNRWRNIKNTIYKPVWSPDGECIAFSTSTKYIWIVSTDGGVPIFVISDYQYETTRRRYYNSIRYFCFTPDSQEITFSKMYYDEEKGSSIDFTENEFVGTVINFGNPVYSIECENIYTGERRFLADGQNPCWSHDGRYLCYFNFDYRRYTNVWETDHDNYLTILDTQTGEKSFLTDGSLISSLQFTPDDTAVIFSLYFAMNEAQLFKIPITGGEPEQITFPIPGGDGTGNYRSYFDISPDGEWILYEDFNHDKFFKTSFSSGPTLHVCLYNLASGETYKLFPEPEDTNMIGEYATFSPDGTKICYRFMDCTSFETSQPKIYIKDIDLDSYVLVEKEPESFAMLENYPNPFNPVTTIQYSVPNNGHVTMKIYNVSGQVVGILRNEYQHAGSYSLTWDAEGLASGLYFCTLTANGFTETRKMVLVR